MAAHRRTDVDSPVEWTGKAHLVSVGCSECGAKVTVSEDVAASPNPVTCEDCVHDCLGHLEDYSADAIAGDVPRHLALYRCSKCGDTWTFDVREGRHERGLPEAIDS